MPNHPPPTARRLLNCRYQLGLFFGCSSVVLRSPWLAPAANRLWLNSINQLSSCSPAAPRDLVDLVNYSAFGGYAKRKIYEIYRFPPAGLGVCHFIYMAQLGLKRFVRSGEIITLSPFFIIGKPNCFRLQRYELFSTWKPFFEKKSHRRPPGAPPALSNRFFLKITCCFLLFPLFFCNFLSSNTKKKEAHIAPPEGCLCCRKKTTAPRRCAWPVPGRCGPGRRPRRARI